jgi:cation diffusion facilitator CzcD-associated flavoprotein CzcO
MFTEKGLLLRSGDELEADIVVTATGLRLKLLGGMQIIVDGKPVDMSRTLGYKGVMFSDVPNLASAFGYTNASWTLKADLTAAYVCRVLNYMDEKGFAACVPRRRHSDFVEEAMVNFTSGYFLRASAILPKQGSKKPWKLYQNYALDTLSLRLGKVDDGTMEFSRRNGNRAV